MPEMPKSPFDLLLKYTDRLNNAVSYIIGSLFIVLISIWVARRSNR